MRKENNVNPSKMRAPSATKSVNPTSFKGPCQGGPRDHHRGPGQETVSIPIKQEFGRDTGE